MNKTLPPPRRFITAAELAKEVGISEDRLLIFIHCGKVVPDARCQRIYLFNTARISMIKTEIAAFDHDLLLARSDDLERFLTANEMAAMLKTSRDRINRLIRTGDLVADGIVLKKPETVMLFRPCRIRQVGRVLASQWAASERRAARDKRNRCSPETKAARERFLQNLNAVSASL